MKPAYVPRHENLAGSHPSRGQIFTGWERGHVSLQSGQRLHDGNPPWLALTAERLFPDRGPARARRAFLRTFRTLP